MEFLADSGPVVYLLFVVVGTCLFLPGSVAMMTGGYLFGFAMGAVLAAIAIPLGALLAFSAARYLLRPWAARRVAAHPRMRAIETAIEAKAFSIIVLTRLSLPIPFNLLNYLYGATSVRARVYSVATAVGMLPPVLLYAYLGSVAKDLEQIFRGDATPSNLAVGLLIVGVIALAIAAWLVHRTASRVLRQHTQMED